MANTIRLKSGSGSNPSASDLVVGEVALRTDGNPKLFTKNDAGSVLEVGLDSLNDKLPLTGGTLTGDVKLNDNVKAKFGTGSDLQIFHNGTDSFLKNSTGDLRIQSLDNNGNIQIQAKQGEESIIAKTDGAVELYYDHSKKFETTSTGVKTTGRLKQDVDSSTVLPTSYGVYAYTPYDHELEIDNNTRGNEGSFAGIFFNAGADSDGSKVGTARISAVETGDYKADLVFSTRNTQFTEKLRIKADGSVQLPNDNQKLQIGAGQDLWLYHTGTDSIIQNYTGELKIAANQLKLKNKDTDETYISCVDNGAVELYYDNINRLQTTSTGIATDTIRSGGLSFPRVQTGGLDLMTFGHGGANTFGELDCIDGMMRIKAGEIRLSNRFGNVDMINCFSFGAVELFHNGTKRIETTSSGATVTGTLTATTFSGSGASLTNIPAGQLTGTLPALDGSNLTGLTVNNANTIDNLDSTQFLRSDTADTATGNITFTDNTKALFGTGSDLEISHNGSNTFITNNTGYMVISSENGSIYNDANNHYFRKADSSEFMAKLSQNGSVELNFDNSKKFETTSTGTRTTGVSIIGSNAVGMGSLNASTQLVVTQLSGNTNSVDLTILGGRSGRSSIAFGDHDDVNVGAIRYNHSDESIDFLNNNQSTSKLIITSGGNLQIPADNKQLQIGAGQDLAIFHDGSNTFIDNATGIFLIRNDNEEIRIRPVGQVGSPTDEESAIFKPNGAVELYFDNSKKFETTSVGTNFHGTAHTITTGDFYPMNDNTLRVGVSNRRWSQIHGYELYAHEFLKLYDNIPAKFGDGDDLQIYHDGSHSYVKTSTGDLRLESTSDDIKLLAQDDVVIRDDTDSINMAQFIQGGAVELYYDNSKKLETFSGGISVTGQVNSDGSHMGDSDKALFGDSNDLQIYHDGSDSYISQTGTGNLILQGNASNNIAIRAKSGEEGINLIPDGAVELYYNNSKKLETTSAGVSIAGTCTLSSHLLLGDGDEIKVGSGEDLLIYHDGSNSYIQDQGTGSLVIQGSQTLIRNTSGHNQIVASNDDVDLYYDNSKKLDTTSYGVFIDGNLQMDDNSMIRLGNSNDLQLLHDGSNSIIDDAGTGVLAIRSDTSVDLLKRTGNEPMLKAIADGSVELYYDNSQKLYTTADGIESKGELHFKSPSIQIGEQTGRIEWWNENDAGVMAKIGVDRKSSTGAPADLVFSTSQNVDTSANGSDGDITERGRFTNNGLRLTNQPCFYAYSNSTRNNYGGGLVVAYLATHHNQGNHYSTSTYRFTAPVDGIYVFGGNPGYVESGQTYSLYLRINGAVRTEVGRVVQGNFPSHSQFGFSVSVKLSANDYVDLYQLGRMHHNAAYSAWWGYFLG